MSHTAMPLDLIEELRLRRWARENYVPSAERQADWHTVIHDEMLRRDLEQRPPDACRRADLVPLMPDTIDADWHTAGSGPHFAAATAELYYH